VTIDEGPPALVAAFLPNKPDTLAIGVPASGCARLVVAPGSSLGGVNAGNRGDDRSYRPTILERRDNGL
jgi:hypothetical protein